MAILGVKKQGLEPKNQGFPSSSTLYMYIQSKRTSEQLELSRARSSTCVPPSGVPLRNNLSFFRNTGLEACQCPMLVRLLTFPFLRGVGSVGGLACRRRVERARVLACHSRAFDTRSGHKKARRARTLRAKEKGP